MTSGGDDAEKRHIVDGGRESAEAADRSQSLGAKTCTARLANDGGSEHMRPPQGDVKSRQGTKHEWRPEAPHVPGALCLAAYARFKPLRTNESQARTPTVWYLGYGDL